MTRTTDPISAAMHYRLQLEAITRAPSLATAIRIAERALEITFRAPEDGDKLFVESGFGHQTKQPFVTLTTSAPTMQMTVDKAREIAWMILSAADAAVSDAFLVAFLQGDGDFSLDEAGAILAAFRAFRDKQAPPAASSA